jgi:hypothetical protein
MSDILYLAFAKAAALPEPAREKIARELLDRIEALSRLRLEVDAGLAELDDGLSAPLDLEGLIREARAEHDKG